MNLFSSIANTYQPEWYFCSISKIIHPDIICYKSHTPHTILNDAFLFNVKYHSAQTILNYPSLFNFKYHSSKYDTEWSFVFNEKIIHSHTGQNNISLHSWKSDSLYTMLNVPFLFNVKITSPHIILIDHFLSNIKHHYQHNLSNINIPCQISFWTF